MTGLGKDLAITAGVLATFAAFGIVGANISADAATPVRLPWHPAACAEAATVDKKLRADFGESVAFSGTVPALGVVFQVHSSDISGSWTATVLLPNGVRCLILAGEAAEFVKRGDRGT